MKLPKVSYCLCYLSLLAGCGIKPEEVGHSGDSLADSHLNSIVKYNSQIERQWNSVTPTPTPRVMPLPSIPPTITPTPTEPPISQGNGQVIGSCQTIKFSSPEISTLPPGMCMDYRLAAGAANQSAQKLSGLANSLKQFCESQGSGKWSEMTLCPTDGAFGQCQYQMSVRTIALVSNNVYYPGGYYEKLNQPFEQVAMACVSPNSANGTWQYLGSPRQATRLLPGNYVACPKYNAKGKIYECLEFVGVAAVERVKGHSKYCLAPLQNQCPRAEASPIACERGKGTMSEYRTFFYTKNQAPGAGNLICTPLDSYPVNKTQLN